MIGYNSHRQIYKTPFHLQWKHLNTDIFFLIVDFLLFTLRSPPIALYLRKQTLMFTIFEKKTQKSSLSFKKKEKKHMFTSFEKKKKNHCL